jgi:hypothetical protein
VGIKQAAEETKIVLRVSEVSLQREFDDEAWLIRVVHIALLWFVRFEDRRIVRSDFTVPLQYPVCCFCCFIDTFIVDNRYDESEVISDF